MLFVILIPVRLGVLLRKYSLTWARRAEASGTVAGLLLVILIAGSNILREGDSMLMIDSSVYLAAVLLGLIGFLLGYLGARLLGLESPQRRAVSLETGLQNIPLAMAIVLISFPNGVQHEVLVVPIFYGIAITPLAMLVAWFLRVFDPARGAPE